MRPQSKMSESVSPGVSSSVAFQPARIEGLSLVPCPDCGVPVKKLVSKTKLNPDRVFYRCSNSTSRCNFWKWEDAYLTYLKKIREVIVTPSMECELVGALESQLIKLIDDLKKKSEDDGRQIEALVASLDNMNIKLHNHMYVIIALLVVVIALVIVVIGIH